VVPAMNDKDRVDRLDDAIIAEVLDLDQAELEDLVDASEVAAGRASLNRAMGAAGKLRLVQAKSEVAQYKSRPKSTGSTAASDDSRVQDLRRYDRALDQKMTLAARSGTADAEADAASLDEDLAELDAWEAEDRGQD